MQPEPDQSVEHYSSRDESDHRVVFNEADILQMVLDYSEWSGLLLKTKVNAADQVIASWCRTIELGILEIKYTGEVRTIKYQ